MGLRALFMGNMTDNSKVVERSEGGKCGINGSLMGK